MKKRGNIDSSFPASDGPGDKKGNWRFTMTEGAKRLCDFEVKTFTRHSGQGERDQESATSTNEISACTKAAVANAETEKPLRLEEEGRHGENVLVETKTNMADIQFVISHPVNF